MTSAFLFFSNTFEVRLFPVFLIKKISFPTRYPTVRRHQLVVDMVSQNCTFSLERLLVLLELLHQCLQFLNMVLHPLVFFYLLFVEICNLLAIICNSVATIPSRSQPLKDLVALVLLHSRLLSSIVKSLNSQVSEQQWPFPDFFYFFSNLRRRY